MIQSLISKWRKLAPMYVLLAVLALCTPLFAQLDYDTYDIFQNGDLVGVIYVPERGADPTVYAEYWIMSNHYQYPSEKNPVTTEIRPSRGYHYTSLADFLEKAPWGDGYHYVVVTAFDRTTKPVAVGTTGE